MSVNEDLRSSLMLQGRRGRKEKGDGKSRYEKRKNSKVASIVREFNQINMQRLFSLGILTVNVPVQGETDNYIVTIKFAGFIDRLRDIVESQNNVFNLRAVVRALTSSFDDNDVYIHCSCPDWRYRMAYFATLKDINSGEPEHRPSNITNPNNDLGPGCKHVMLVLSNNKWLLKVASTVNNYVKYMERARPKEYADIIYPAIYNKKYEKPVQLSFDDTDELDSSTGTLDIANEIGRTSGRFRKKDNET